MIHANLGISLVSLAILAVLILVLLAAIWDARRYSKLPPLPPIFADLRTHDDYLSEFAAGVEITHHRLRQRVIDAIGDSLVAKMSAVFEEFDRSPAPKELPSGDLPPRLRG